MIAAIKNTFRLWRDHRKMKAMRKANLGQTVYVMPPWNEQTMRKIITENLKTK
jgi:hypothetical protein